MTSKIKDKPFHKIASEVDALGIKMNTNVSVFINSSKASTDGTDNHRVSRSSDNRYQRAIKTLTELFNVDSDGNINVYSVGSKDDLPHGGARFLGTCRSVDEILTVYDAAIDCDNGLPDCPLSSVTNKAVQMYESTHQYQVIVFLTSGAFNTNYKVNDMCQLNRASHSPICFTTVSVDSETGYLEALDNHKKKDLDLDKQQKKELKDMMKDKTFKLLIDNINSCDINEDILQGQDPSSPDTQQRLYHQVMMEVPKHYKFWRDKQKFRSSRNSDVFIESPEKYISENRLIPFRYVLETYVKNDKTHFEFKFCDKDAPKYPVRAGDVMNVHKQPQTYQASPQSYQAPPQTYQAPPQTYQAPPQSYQAPPQTYQAPPQTYQAPPQSYQAPPQTYQAPPQSYQAPPQSYQVPPQTYQAPPQTYQAPPQTYQEQQGYSQNGKRNQYGLTPPGY